MKLIHKSILYLLGALLIIVGLWSMFSYYNILREIRESVDEGLENYKRQIILNVENNPSLLSKNNFEEGFFAIKEISKDTAQAYVDTYKDLMLYQQDIDDEYPELEPVRMLSTTFQSRGKYYELKIINSMVEEDDLVKELFYEALLLYLFLAIGLLLINKLVLEELWQPFYDLLAQVQQFRLGGNTSYPNITTNTKEFVDLQNAINVHLKENSEVYERQKQFIGNASHELQTPLAIMSHKLEALLEKDEHNPQEIAEVLGLTEQMAKLNKSLMLLTKIENGQFQEIEPIAWDYLLEQVIEENEDWLAYKEISVVWKNRLPLVFAMDKSLAHILLRNLVRNAIGHTANGGQLVLDVQSHQLAICNPSTGKSLNAEQVFKRFYKANRSQKGSGLGLAIVKAICDNTLIVIRYDFVENNHVFTLEFPDFS